MKRLVISIFIPNTIKKIGQGAFQNIGITKFDMPDSVSEIGSNLFAGCEQLTEIRLSDNIEYLPNLGGWGKLPALQKSNLPKNLKRIYCENFGAFSHCSELIDLVIPDTLQSLEFGKYDDFWAKEGYGEKDGWFKSGVKYRYPVETIDDETFKGCSKLPIKTRQALQALGYKGEF